MSTELPYEISVQDTAALLADQADVRLIDCREDDEFAICRIEGSQLIPLSVFAEKIDSALGPDAAQQRIIVHCHHGARSLRAVHFLRQKGYTNAQSMAGGIDAWSLEIDENVPRY